VEGQHVAVILDAFSGARRTLPRPIYAVSPDGQWALSISLARLAHARSIVGYAGVADPFEHDGHPREDGVWRMDLATGKAELVLSIDEVYRFRPAPSMEGLTHRFEHVTISPDGGRFFLMHRWPRQGKGRPFHDRLFTASPNAGAPDPCLLAGDDLVSHFDWRDGQHVLAWAGVEGRNAFYLFEDRTNHRQIVGPDVLTVDGHCSYSPDRRWASAATPTRDGAATAGRCASTPPTRAPGKCICWTCRR
jgi:hypothetical protein